MTDTHKPEGSIADAFASLSGQAFAPLEPRFATIKANLIQGHEEAVQASWNRLLSRLATETETITKMGSSIIPSIPFSSISQPPADFTSEYLKRGVAIIRNVLPSSEALSLKEDLKAYIAANPHTRAFPESKPQVYELYWSPSQIRARSHPNMLATYRFLLNHWHSDDPNALFSTEPILYADRLRIRTPGDAQFALGPHVDGGGPERWEPTGYGLGRTFEAVWRGEWESYDPWESSRRLAVESSLYNGGGACSVFRTSQGWLSLSSTGPGEGTLLVNPLLSLATAYMLLRPFFAPKSAPAGYPSGNATQDELSDPSFLAASNWTLESPTSSWLHGANPGRGQELSPSLHPHLRLNETMVHVPHVEPGDYVAWHCDTIHAVDKTHSGTSDSSVMYIPTAPLTERNAENLARQRDAFLRGVPPPDFPGGEGEARHIGRPGSAEVASVCGAPGMRTFGLERWEQWNTGKSEGAGKMIREANRL